MAQYLPDGSVVPSFQAIDYRGAAQPTGHLNNLALRMGEVREVIYPSDTRSITKRFTEYTVEVQHRDGSAPGTTAKYYGCIVANLFGGGADQVRYTLRPPENSSDRKARKDGMDVGSKVLLLCVNGQTTRAMILGGLRDLITNDQDADKKEDGHHYFSEFNGISYSINDAGEYTLKFRGATKVDGTLRGEDHGPTTVQLLKDGSFKVSDAGGQVVHVDHANKRIHLEADQEWSVKVNGKGTESYGSSYECTAGSTLTLNATGNSYIKSAGLMVGAATDAVLLGTRYRIAEAALHQGMGAQLQALAAALPGIALANPLLAPLISALAPVFLGLSTSLQSFEAQAPNFLSLKNKTD